MMQPLHRIRSIWRRATLLQQFLAAATVTICVSMAVLTYSVSTRLESSIMQAAAEEGALLVGHFIGPHVQELASSDVLSPQNVERLDAMLQTVLNERVKVIKIWMKDGRLVYATNNKLIGEKFPSDHLDKAFGGRVSGSFDDLDDDENTYERELKVPLIEIYAPFYRTGTREVIAVGEVYNDGSRLLGELSHIRTVTAGIVGAVTAPMMLLLFLIVRRASAIVAAHGAALSRKVDEAKALADQNDQLRREADEARLDAIQSNEGLLGQIGQDLHDGPIQLLSILTLKLSEMKPADSGSTALPMVTGSATGGLADLTAAALSDLRDLSIGLVLPQLEGLNARETLLLAVRQHEALTGTRVLTEIGDLTFFPPPPLRTCLFRIVQEGLNNAYYYASGQGQHVSASGSAGQITIVVRDSGSADAPASPRLRKTGLGLPGLHRRVQGFRGSLEIAQLSPGTELRATLPMGDPAGG
ncbi:ATP-binding protein [Rhodopseudomonas palustris]|nr:ATP-binding protein [Rhodopseudomonas palustris]